MEEIMASSKKMIKYQNQVLVLGNRSEERYERYFGNK